MNASGWRGVGHEVLGVDLRGLALFRFALGSVLALDLLGRLADLGVFYTDAGLMPRAWAQALGGPLRLSLHFANGDAWFAALLLVLELLAALALAFGYRARAASVAAFVLHASLLNRNPAILVDADTLLAALLFWAMFLPLNARWSVDAALAESAPPERHDHASAASAGLILQVLAVPFFTALSRSDPEWWSAGTALQYALMHERSSSAFGQLLLAHPEPLRAMTHALQGIGLAAPLLALSPVLRGPLRLLALVLLVAAALVHLALFELGVAPFVWLASLTVLLGRGFWDWADRALDRGHSIRVYYDRDCRGCLATYRLLATFLVLRRCDLQPAQDSVRASALMQAQSSWVVIDAYDVAHTRWNAWVALLRHSLLLRWLAPLAGMKFLERTGDRLDAALARRRARLHKVIARLPPSRRPVFEVRGRLQWLAGAVAALMLCSNLVHVGALPGVVAWLAEPPLRALRLDARWDLFAPAPSRDDGWYVIPGVLDDGSEVDLRTGAAVAYAKPRSLADTEPGLRWRTYHTRIALPEHAAHRRYYAHWLCNESIDDATEGRRLASLRIVYMLERAVAPDRVAPIEQRVLWRENCLDAGTGADGAPASGQ